MWQPPCVASPIEVSRSALPRALPQREPEHVTPSAIVDSRGTSSYRGKSYRNATTWALRDEWHRAWRLPRPS